MGENEIQEGKKHMSKTLLQSLYEQRGERSFCDVKLTVEGSEIWCHACVLTSCSYYFRDILQANCSLKSHWCFRNPLEINILEMMKNSIDVCSVCIVKIIDSMYLNKLVIVKGHLEHFLKIVKFFKVVDLLPLCVKYSSSGTELQGGKKEIELNLNDTLTNKESLDIKETYNKYSEKDLDTEKLENVQPKNVLLKKNEQTTGVFEQVKNTMVEGKNNLMSSNECVSKPKLSADHNYVITEPVKNENCEFVCCNSFETSVPTEGEWQSEKRVLRCEVCTLATVSVRKMLKHLENSKHFGNVCAICYLKLPSIDLAKVHLKDHLDAKPYVCHICKKRNRIWAYHKLHYKVHCKNKQFICGVCEKSFKHKQTLSAHMNSHEKIYSSESSDVSNKKTRSKSKETSNTNISKEFVNSSKSGESTVKKFYCQLCNKSFTQKKNLMRHSQLKHLTKEYLKCLGCNYQTKRSDLLRQHTKKYHKELVVEESSKPKLKKQCKQDKAPIVGIMIPVQLVSSTDSLSLNGFVVEKLEEATRKFQNEQSYLSNETSLPNTVNIISNKTNDSSFHNISSVHATPHQSEKENRIVNDDVAQIDCSPLMLSGSILTPPSDESRISFADSKEGCTLNVRDTKSDTNVETNSDNYDIVESLVHCNNQDFKHIENSSTKSLSGIWLNEATGELLDENSFLNVHLVDSSRIETKAITENSILDMKTPLQALILNEMPGGLPLLDFGDETDNFQSNPQTPQTSVVEIEETDNLFSWNYLEASFYSTWVLNEATGELNMVSFNMQPFKDSEALNLDENTNKISSTDDDDTALFLNEGTGDLSVIYFNPNKCDHLIPDHPLEQMNQEDQDNMSEHSNEDRNDLLNEEFLIASANFMAYEENEIFLNELTGEFDTTALSQYQPRKEENQQRENVYLNEETGEISWNILDKNIGRDFFTNSENLNFDESLNYEDFDLTEDINDFQFQSSFGLDTNISSDWHDEPCGTLLNECTGEFVTKQS